MNGNAENTVASSCITDFLSLASPMLVYLKGVLTMTQCYLEKTPGQPHSNGSNSNTPVTVMAQLVKTSVKDTSRKMLNTASKSLLTTDWSFGAEFTPLWSHSCPHICLFSSASRWRLPVVFCWQSSSVLCLTPGCSRWDRKGEGVTLHLRLR